MTQDSVSEPRTNGRAGEPSTVLVLADDARTRATLEALFAGAPAYRVHQAETLAAAMDIYTSVRVHLVVLALSDHDAGLESLKTLVGSDRRRRVPVVVALRGAYAGDHLDFLRAGADDVVSNDSDDELLARVSRRLSHERERETHAMVRRYSLAGDLSGLGLTDLVTVLEQGAVTGSLELLTRRGSAQLLIREGQIRYAAFGNTRGRFAFFELLREREGQFEFTPGEWPMTDASGALDGPNTLLLLEGSQVMDENPDEAPAVLVRPTAQKPSRRMVPALPPDAELAAEWLHVIGDPSARGEIRLLARDQVRDWTAQPLGGKRLRLALVTDVMCGVHIVSHLAAPLALEEIANSLRRSPAALGFTWKIESGQSLEILLLDQERLQAISDVVLGSPAVLIFAPSYGDFLTCGVSSRAALQRLLRDAMPLAILAVGNEALEGQLRTYLKLAKLEFPTQFLRGSLWKLEVTPRALLEAAIRQWAELRGMPRSRAA